MLKHIVADQLRPGMYVHKLPGSWLEHPFWKSSFAVRKAEDVARIRASGVRELWIDTSRGLDVEAQAETPVAAKMPAAAAPEPMDPGVPAADTEVAAAERLVAAAREQVVAMFEDARMGRAITADGAAPLVEEISNSVARNPHALVSVARLKTADDYTYMHSVAVCGLMIALSRQLNLGEQETREAGLAGLLHDVGKMAIDPLVLNKPDKLTDEEFLHVKQHPLKGFEMLQGGKGITDAALDVCLHHHEKIDGSGYPKRLSGDQISLFAKMGAVCDVYDAVTSNRAYKAGWSPAESMRRMASWSKSHFDERVFQAFVKAIGIYPVGTLVRLRSGVLGVIVGQSNGNLLVPRVKVFMDAKRRSRIPPYVIDLSQDSGNAIASHEDPALWQITDLEQIWRDPAPGR